MFGLTDQLISRFSQVFQQYPGIDHVLIFGSRATGRYRPGSDIDLAVSVHPDADVDFAVLADQLDALNTPYLIDLVDIRQLSDNPLLEQIRTHGQPFYPVSGADNG
ncbi:MAG: nucleotidyltransferase domain-containing protein [Oceanospirillum sp.]|nr:nucleotidyltransferase domain-containing protein [Oceanospirillum sp.]